MRSLENEKALERMAITQGQATSLLLASVFLNLGLTVSATIPTVACYVAATAFGGQALSGVAKLKVFDKKSRQFENSDFSET